MSTKQAKLQLQRQQRAIKDDIRQGRSDHPHPTRVVQRVDSMGRSQFQQQSRPEITQRQRSPLTPPSAVDHVASASPYFFPKLEQFEMPYEDMYKLEDVQGVCVEDGPLFCTDSEPHFQSDHPMSNHHY